MKVSIVIPAHNAAATLRECLTACLNQTFHDYEVIVVDDGSTDTTPKIAREFPVALIQQPQRGPAVARNAGAKAASGDVIAFTDSDCIPHPDWIDKLTRDFGDRVGAVGGTYGIANRQSLLARMVHEEIAARHGKYTSPVDFLGSYNLAVVNEVFREVGGFDESFRAASGEDNDLSYRIADAGYTLWFARAAIVDHYHPTRVLRYLRTQARHGVWRVKLYRKHPHRATGDKYAGLTDMAAPVLVLLFFFALLVTVVGPLNHGPTGFIAWLVPAAAFVIFRTQPAFAMVGKHRDPRFLLFAPLVLARDFVRGIGLVYGVWVFLVLRRESA